MSMTDPDMGNLITLLPGLGTLDLARLVLF